MHQSRSLPQPPATIHLVGIGGIGVSGLARILTSRGYTVTGSDMVDGPVLDELRALGITFSIGHDPANVAGAALVVTTAAAPPDNPELVAAQRAGIPVIKRARLLGELTSDRTSIAVAGTHGKSTTSGMFAWALNSAGVEPSYAVGASVSQLGANAAPGGGPHFVVEADEYDYSFLELTPDLAIITNIDHDHPDLFPDFDATERAYQQFVKKIRSGGALILSADDPGCRRMIDWIREQELQLDLITVGRSFGAEWRLDDTGGSSHLIYPERDEITFNLAVPGAHNRMNAAMVIAAAYWLALDVPAIIAGLETFTGVGRRFDLRAEINGVRIFDDYAHHPTELRATIEAAREQFPGSRIRAVFQPHTYSRTRQLLHEFADALDTADSVALVDIYPARETDTLGVSSLSIARLMNLDVDVYATPSAAAHGVAAEVESGDVVLFIGAGDIWQAAPVLIEQLKGKAGTDG